MSNDIVTAQWLERARSAVNADPAFRQRGSIDVRMGVKCGNEAHLVQFAGFSCHGVGVLNPADTRDADFILEMTADQWRRFLDGRRAGTGRTLAELATSDDVVKAANPRKRLDFLRFHTSLQAFFDAGVQAAA